VKLTRSAGEIGAVILTALLQPVFVMLLRQRALFILLALVAWAIYLVGRCRTERGAFREWGFRKEGLAAAFAATTLFALAALLVMGGLALAHHTLVVCWPMLVLLALYPIYGLFQQLLLQGVFVRAVTASATGVWPKIGATLLAAILFGAIHLPDTKLVIATFVLGLIFTPIYLRWRNLWPLGLYHGWLGVFFYYWLLGRDPWAELFAGGL
jgi:uncharacterized protein